MSLAYFDSVEILSHKMTLEDDKGKKAQCNTRYIKIMSSTVRDSARFKYKLMGFMVHF
jgi:hypothetical protein